MNKKVQMNPATAILLMNSIESDSQKSGKIYFEVEDSISNLFKKIKKEFSEEMYLIKDKIFVQKPNFNKSSFWFWIIVFTMIVPTINLFLSLDYGAKFLSWKFYIMVIVAIILSFVFGKTSGGDSELKSIKLDKTKNGVGITIDKDYFDIKELYRILKVLKGGDNNGND